MRRKILLLTAALMLSACASGMPPTTVEPRPCSASLTTDCPYPPPAKSGKVQDLLDNHIEAMELYSQCRDQLKKLAECANSEAGR